jgi:hypothetical protein
MKTQDVIRSDIPADLAEEFLRIVRSRAMPVLRMQLLLTDSVEELVAAVYRQGLLDGVDHERHRLGLPSR